MRFLRRALGVLATVVLLLSCGRTTTPSAENEGFPRAALQAEPVSQLLANRPHRLAVVFWPQLSTCAACDLMVSEVVTEWQKEPHSEVVVISVVPNTATNTTAHLGLPGEIVQLKPEDYKRYAGRSPRPRVEIWNSRGDLLLLRSVPNYGSQADLLTEEMLAARSYTAPIEFASKAQATR